MCVCLSLVQSNLIAILQQAARSPTTKLRCRLVDQPAHKPANQLANTVDLSLSLSLSLCVCVCVCVSLSLSPATQPTHSSVARQPAALCPAIPWWSRRCLAGISPTALCYRRWLPGTRHRSQQIRDTSVRLVMFTPTRPVFHKEALRPLSNGQVVSPLCPDMRRCTLEPESAVTPV